MGGDLDFLEDHHRNHANLTEIRRMLPRTNPKPRLDLPRNPRSKIRGRPIIHRNNNHAA